METELKHAIDGDRVETCNVAILLLLWISFFENNGFLCDIVTLHVLTVDMEGVCVHGMSKQGFCSPGNMHFGHWPA